MINCGLAEVGKINQCKWFYTITKVINELCKAMNVLPIVA